MGCGDVIGMSDPLAGSLIGTGPLADKPRGKKKIPGGRIIKKGEALLNAYNTLLPGTMDLVTKSAAQFGDLYRAEAEKTRADELEGFEEYGPRYVEAIDAADPLRAKAKGIISANLDEGLDPAVAREIQQGSRAAFSSRGMLNSPASAVEELFALGTRGKMLEQVNLNNAMGMIGSTDPFLAYAGRPSAPQGSNVMSPNYAGFNDDLFTYDVNAEMMRNANAQASKNRTASYINSGISALGSLGGGAMSFI